MKAYVYGANGAEITDVAKPSPKGTQVLIKVSACGLNRADLGMTKGHAHGAAGGVGTVLGMEWAGEVAELGPDAKGVKVGDKIKGCIVNVGRLGGTHADFNFDLHAARRIQYIGVTFRTRTIQEVREIFDEVRKDIWPAVESRKLQLPIDKVFPFAEIGNAFAHMEANKHLGKIVVTL